MASLIEVDQNSREAVSFDDWANLGTPDTAMTTPSVTMPDFSALRAGFDRPVPATPALGAYAYPQPDEFDRRMSGFRIGNYWGNPTTGKGIGEVGAAVATNALDAVGSLFEAGAPRKMEVAQPAVEQVAVSSLSEAMNGLSRAERYKVETVQQARRKPGNDYA